MKTVCIIGLGYVGLPLACLCAEKGHRVNGFDLDKSIVEKTNRGVSHIRDKGLEEELPRLRGKISASTEPDAIKEADIVIVCVPTPAKQGKPDLGPLKKASQTISKFLQKNQLVVIESTVYPGTVEEIVKPILEESGLKAGQGFFLGHCPERIDPGNKKFSIEIIPRVLACLSSEGTEKARQFYETIIDGEIMVLGSVRAAEAVKVVENTFRDVNIAFVNELAKSFDKMGIDLSEVIKGASTKPFGFMPFYPGPGVGGHCIGQDPYYLIAKAKQSGFEHKFLQLAREINNSMPAHVVMLVEAALIKAGLGLDKTKIAVLGIAYKPGVDDTRKSPGLEIVKLLKEKGLAVKAFDPFVKGESDCSSLEEALSNVEAVVLATDHKQFVDFLTPAFLKGKQVKVVIDARNALDKQGIEKQGIIYKGIGR